jgi:hypothetical protein
MTHIGQMSNPKPLIIFLCICQKILARMSMELIGSLDDIWEDFNFGLEVGQVTAHSFSDFSSRPDQKLTQNDLHGPQMSNPKPLIIFHCTCQEILARMSMELIGSLDDIW